MEYLPYHRGNALHELFHVPKPIIGVVHVKPLPGSPWYDGDIESVIDFALRDAEALKAGGVDGLHIENLWDKPFLIEDEIGFETVSALAVIGREVRKATGLPIGSCCVHNGTKQMIAIAVAAGAKWIRASEWVLGSISSYGGFLRGQAGRTLRYRSFLKADHIKIFSDIMGKVQSHALTADRPLEEQVIDAEVAGVDVIVVSGLRTGFETPIEYVKRAKSVAHVPVITGSGTNLDNLEKTLKFADGAIIGTWFKKEGNISNPVDYERVKKLMKKVKEIRDRQQA